MPNQSVQIIEQIVRQMRVSVTDTTSTMEMQLNPERLGKVLLTISAKEGMMTANFTVQTEEARLALESQMYQLRDTLEQKEIKVEAVSISVSDFPLHKEAGMMQIQKIWNRAMERVEDFNSKIQKRRHRKLLTKKQSV